MKVRDEFKQLIEEHYFSVPEDIIANRKIQLFDNGQCFYILSVEKPAVGYCGCFNQDTLVKFRNKPRNDSDLETTRKNKASKMKKRIKRAKSKYIAKKEATEPDDRTELQLFDMALTVPDFKSVERLSALSCFDYDRVRSEEANKLNIRVSTLDKYVVNKRKLDSVRILGPKLLSDIHAIVVDMDAEQIRTEDLLIALCSAKGKTWATFDKGRQITSKQLASILEQYMVGSQDKRLKTGGVYKGYTKKSILEAFSRYHDPSGADITKMCR